LQAKRRKNLDMKVGRRRRKLSKHNMAVADKDALLTKIIKPQQSSDWLAPPFLHSFRYINQNILRHRCLFVSLSAAA